MDSWDPGHRLLYTLDVIPKAMAVIDKSTQIMSDNVCFTPKEHYRCSEIVWM